ncbi:vWA domain-containing protein [Frigoriglobus tundricola]|uniref:VWFA domain-containing protein n=1 Tax=Frigoriglobus tundricola TaxID=2774151 RepID=A0A6M5Z108_9BACT|nr:vWA domain-containing protein [Frigoriglobus tundricola]QJW99484.1 hypothetical protein FTUN_7096 [Frigoriglobus tundricola]
MATSSTKGVVDVVFCLDASGSMAPCIDGVRRNLDGFLDALAGDANRKIDCRLDFLAHSCGEDGDLVRSVSLRKSGADLIQALYGQVPQPAAFFTTDRDAIRRGLKELTVYGDEAMLVALDMALDFPWRPQAGCHRVVVVLTDEPLEANAIWSLQQTKLDAIIDKVQKLGVKLYLVGPNSAGLDTLAEADKCLYQKSAQTYDGLGSIDFAKVLGQIGKSVSSSLLQARPESAVKRALFGQDEWVASQDSIRGGR